MLLLHIEVQDHFLWLGVVVSELSQLELSFDPFGPECGHLYPRQVVPHKDPMPHASLHLGGEPDPNPSPVAGRQLEGFGVWVQTFPEPSLHLVGETDEGPVVVLDVEDPKNG